ncbi:hypothetical protein ABFS83_06G072600 [Erythranthe nasuta]
MLKFSSDSGGCASSECCGAGTFNTERPNFIFHAEQAKSIILRDNPLVNDVRLIPKGSGVIHDFCCNRVWLFFDENKRVVLVPMVG